LSQADLDPVAGKVEGVVSKSLNTTILDVPSTKVTEACVLVSQLEGFNHLSTITGMDEGKEISLRYHFWRGKEFIVVRTKVGKTSPSIDSISKRLPAATLYEAEIQDLLGVSFVGNPYLGKRLLLPDDYPADAPPPLRSEADPQKIRKMMGLE
jgi:Ni,Fe-hydrogenase III component G